MIKKSLLFILFIQSIIFARIPIDENKIRITSTFGEFRTDHFHNGVDFGGNRMPIYPIADGEIVHYSDFDEDPTRPVYGVGNTLIVEHSEGIRSYYYHIDDGSIEKNYAKVTENDILALTGNTGRSGGAHLHLTIEDMKKGLVIDPLAYLDMNKGSEQSPLIHGIYLRTENRLIQIKDNMSIKIYMNDDLLRDYDFTYFIKQNNVYYISPDYRFEDVYGVDSHYYRGGSFIPKRGKYIFKAEVTDFDDKSVVLTRSVNFH